MDFTIPVSLYSFTHIQSQVAHRDKALKVAAEQKELLQHEEKKVENDLKDMVSKNRSKQRSVEL